MLVAALLLIKSLGLLDKASKFWSVLNCGGYPLARKSESLIDEMLPRVFTYLITNTKKYHIFAPMGRFQLELIYLYFPPSSYLIYVGFCPVGLSLL